MKVQEMNESLEEYLKNLTTSELSARTREKYHNDILRFLAFCGEKTFIDKETVMEYKQYLLRQYKVSTVNSYLISLNRYLSCINHAGCTVKTIRTQRKTGLENVLNREEYARLLELRRS